ncbi:MAG: F0F1 ATP synthase subunit B family protein [Limisphaerales bacterium]
MIDWFTVGAQFVNFIVLVALLKWLFYRPILNAMAAREERIASALRDAAGKNAAAEAQLNAVQKQEQEIQNNRARLLKTAADEAEASRLKLVTTAKEEVTAMRQRWVEAAQRDKERVEHELVGTLQSELLALVGTVLRDLSGTQLEDAIAKRFVAQLKAIAPGDKARMRSDSKSPPVIRSSFAMPQQSQHELQEVVEQELGAGTVRFETAPDLVCGVELATEGHKLSWNVQDWLRSFERSLQESLDNTATHARP